MTQLHPCIQQWLATIAADPRPEVLPAAEAQLERIQYRYERWALDNRAGPNPAGEGVTAWDLAEAAHELNRVRQRSVEDSSVGGEA